MNCKFQTVMDLKKKVQSSRSLFLSHIEALQNVVRLHKATSNAGLEEISSMASANAHSIDEVGSNNPSHSIDATSIYGGFYVYLVFDGS